MKTYVAKIDHELLMRTCIVYIGEDLLTALNMIKDLDEHSKRNYIIEVWENGISLGKYRWSTTQRGMAYSLNKQEAIK